MADVRAARLYRHVVPRLRHSPPSQRNVTPSLQMLDCVATVAPLYMQMRASGARPAVPSLSPVHAIARFLHAPSSQRYRVPDWQLTEPVEYELPSRSQPLAAAGGLSAQAAPHPFHCPSSQRYWVPDWQAVEPCE